MGDPYLILRNPQHEHVYTDEQLASYRTFIYYTILYYTILYYTILFLFAGNKDEG